MCSKILELAASARACLDRMAELIAGEFGAGAMPERVRDLVDMLAIDVILTDAEDRENTTRNGMADLAAAAKLTEGKRHG